ncbi:head GIN domain-containing protein [Niastella yeongjuensis]|nr:head GIN domain-containing protein [Niastella yeongjuensis]SEP44549.1 Putative auto-transporter adhesin, head GIN domain [Niastella yeongjuensis]
MKNFHLALCVILLLIVSFSCKKITGKGPVVVESRQTATFDGLNLKIPAELYFKQDSVFKIELQAQENILDEIETAVINNELQIRFRHDITKVRSNDGITVLINGPDVRSFTVDGSGYLEIPDLITPANMSLHVNGSGNLKVNNVNTTEVNGEISGSGIITVSSGNANTNNLKISGSGLINASGLMVKDARANVKGSGNIQLFATQTLDATISGSGSILFKGSPAVTTHISGSGTVTKM